MKRYFIFLIVSLFSLTSVFAAGGGGGGGGSGGGSDADITFTSDNTQVSDDIKEGSSETIKLSNGMRYKITVNEAGLSTARVFINDKTEEIPLDGNKEVDLDGDGVNDLRVFYNSKSGRTGGFAFRELRGEERVRVKAQMENKAERLNRAVSEKRDLPEQASRGDGLKCGHLATVKERVDCRLKLGKDEKYKENELLYLPEECRALSGDEQDRCIDIYKKTQRCWANKKDRERVDCVKQILELKKPIKEHKDDCKKILGNATECKRELKRKVHDSIKFRFYNLEEKAEKLLEEDRASPDDVTALVAALEQKKVEFNEAKTKDEKKRIIKDVRDIWKEFVKKVKEFNKPKRSENEG